LGKDGGDTGLSAGLPRLHRIESDASRGAPASKLVLPCFSQSAAGGSEIRLAIHSTQPQRVRGVRIPLHLISLFQRVASIPYIDERSTTSTKHQERTP